MKRLILLSFLALVLFSCSSTKEQAQTLNFDYRIYNTRLGRSYSIDTTKTTVNNSPYKFTQTNIIKIDSIK